MMTRYILICIMLFVPATYTAAQQAQLPPLDPKLQLEVCQQQRGRFLSDAESASAYASQFYKETAELKAEIAELRKKLAEPK